VKLIAAILADLDVSPIGTRSRLAEPLAGVPVLRRTVQRVRRIEGLDSVHVLVPSKQHVQVQELLRGLAADVHPADLPPAPHQAVVTLARKWALGNWRGGISGACGIDESFHAAALLALGQAVRADGVMMVPAHAALLNVDLSQRMLEHFLQQAEHYRIVLSQSPPGLTPVFLAMPLLADLDRTGFPPGVTMAYNPAAPEPDRVAKPICYQVPTPVVCSSGRWLADTAESFAMCQAAVKELGEDLADDAIALCRFRADRDRQYIPAVPNELEIELTTEDSLPATLLRPRGPAVPRRGPLELALLEKVLEQMARRDDALVVLGGFGDPLCHPKWPQAIRLARQAGVFGISVHTTGKRLAEVGAEAVLAEPPDLLVVRLDAASEDVYRQVQGEAGYERAAEAVLALERLRRQSRQVRPLIVPAMIKTRLNVRDQEAFFDHWMRQVGSAWIEGYSDRAAQCDRLQVASMAPPTRITCRRLRCRMLMLADGRAVACDQDFRGVQPVGDLRVQDLRQVWLGEAMHRLREYQPGGDGHDPLLCAKCEEWARP